MLAIQIKQTARPKEKRFHIPYVNEIIGSVTQTTQNSWCSNPKNIVSFNMLSQQTHLHNRRQLAIQNLVDNSRCGCGYSRLLSTRLPWHASMVEAKHVKYYVSCRYKSAASGIVRSTSAKTAAVNDQMLSPVIEKIHYLYQYDECKAWKYYCYRLLIF